MPDLSAPAPRIRNRLLAGLVGLIVLATAVPVVAWANPAGFRTSQDPMLMPIMDGVIVEALITVGETLPGGYRFEAIPDGIALRNRGAGRIDVYVNHETSTVPFPYTPAAPTPANSQNDFDNAQLSRLIFNQQSGRILAGKMVVTSGEGFQRFCSNYLATAAEGFDRPLLFTNEEAIDWVNRTGQSWPATIGADEARQAGVVLAYDPQTGERRPIWGMGRHNHENTVPVPLPDYDGLALLSGDDTFTNSPSQSQLYSYIAPNRDAVWNDEGALWAFVSDDPAYQDYEDFGPGDANAISGHFVEVPRAIATGRNADGTDVVAADFGFPLPPNSSAWQRDPNGIGIDGPQWVLDYWSQTNDVFNFVRLEDIAYDKRPGMSNVVYLVDSGRGTSGAVADRKSTNGRVWEMVLDPADPTNVRSLRVLIEGDDSPIKIYGEIHQPDNIESTAAGLYITEDPGSSQQFNFAEPDLSNPNRTTARLWQYGFATEAINVVVAVDQGLDEGSTDVDPFTTRGNLGAWESSGVVDASAAFGPGAFLIDVQAGTLWIEMGAGADNVAPAGADFTLKRAGGQLLLIRVPGG